MPRLRIRRKRRRDEPLKIYRAYLNARIDDIFEWYFLTDEDMPLLRQAYERYRDDLTGRGWNVAGQRNSAWWLFESPEKRDASIPEVEQLERLGQLTKVELIQLRARARGIANEFHETLFRRSWAWWRFLSPVRRDYDVPEAIQLAGIPQELTGREKHIIAEKSDYPNWPRNVIDDQRASLAYLALNNAEREFLGLPEVKSPPRRTRQNR